MSVLIAGSIALDDLKTPFGERKDILGGSGTHSSISASFFSGVKLVGVVGKDFPKEHLDLFRSKGVDIEGLKISDGKTFHWEGFYEYDMNQAHTIKTDLNVLGSFDPRLPGSYKDSEYIFLANLDPDIQMRIIEQLNAPKFVVADTMNFWISNKKDALKKLMKHLDVMLMNDMEARQFSGQSNLIKAAAYILGTGCRYVIIKKGEHGALLFSKDTHFSAPSYPQENLIDPTGAGDSFAGGFIGYIAKKGVADVSTIKKAIIIGSVMASFNVEDFSLDRLRTLKRTDITSRYDLMKKCVQFDDLGPELL